MLKRVGKKEGKGIPQDGRNSTARGPEGSALLQPRLSGGLFWAPSLQADGSGSPNLQDGTCNQLLSLQVMY